MKQLVYVCLDGLGDDPIPELGGQTPLEAARTPNLDRLAAQGSQGLVTTVGPDIAPESDIAVFAILGLRPAPAASGAGRAGGPRLGHGLPGRRPRAPGELRHAGRRRDRRPPRGPRPSQRGLARARARRSTRRSSCPTPGSNCGPPSSIAGPWWSASTAGPLSAEVGNTDPAYRKEGPLGVALETFESRVARAVPLDDSEEAARSADLVNRFTEESARVLEVSEVNARRRAEGRLAANLILCRDGGDHVPHLTPIRERFGPSWGCFVEMPVERGIAMVLGMAPVDAPGGPPAPRAVRGVGGAGRRGAGRLRRAVHPHQGPRHPGARRPGARQARGLRGHRRRVLR